MEKIIHLRFHHQGKFKSTGYVGGTETCVYDVETEIFSYTVLMEHVKDDLKYSEIGGVYASTKKLGDWKMLASDSELTGLVDQTNSSEFIDFYIDNVIDMSVDPIKKMQPHVVIRPRPNLVAGTILLLFTSCK